MSNQPYQKIKPYSFISYCREEVAFADNLSLELAMHGILTWVDIRHLVPGRGWQEQLDEGLKGAETVLLIVSKESMKSHAVKEEWTKALQIWNKRVILILFEPAKLPQELAEKNLDWVDFTGNFEKAIDSLLSKLSKTEQEHSSETVSAIPQKGKRLPGAIKWFIALSMLMFVTFSINIQLILSYVDRQIGLGEGAKPFTGPLVGFQFFALDLYFSIILLSFPTTWNLIQTPWRVFNRTHKGEAIRNSLYMTLYSTVATLIVYIAFDDRDNYIPRLSLLNLVVCLALLYIAHSNAMYRWAGKMGVIIRPNKPDLMGHTENGTPMLVGIEYAPQDRRYAEEFKSSIEKKAGHHITDDLQQAEIVLCLLSVYKTDSIFDPQEKVIFPVLLQKCRVADHLSHLQRIDLRYGKLSIDAVANLLDEPHELIPRLGVLPVRTTILPTPIKLVLSLFSILFPILLYSYSMELLSLLVDDNTISVLSRTGRLLMPFIIVGNFLLRKFIADRKVNYLPFLTYEWAVGVALLLAVAMTIVFWSPDWSLLIIAPIFWGPPLFLLRKEVKLWMPARK
ncbi:MAG: toll/interleukin-1 receptor domain-containing protein [Anaerolineales bacterium]